MNEFNSNSGRFANRTAGPLTCDSPDVRQQKHIRTKAVQDLATRGLTEPTIKINLTPLRREVGSAELPSDIALCCPTCGELAADKGQCLIEMRAKPDPKAKTGFSVGLEVDCRKCCTSDRPPAIVRKVR